MPNIIIVALISLIGTAFAIFSGYWKNNWTSGAGFDAEKAIRTIAAGLIFTAIKLVIAQYAPVLASYGIILDFENMWTFVTDSGAIVILERVLLAVYRKYLAEILPF